MQEQVFQLTFVGTRRADVAMDTGAPAQAALAASRRGFDAAGLTGLMLGKAKRRLYHLEGAREAVMAYFEKVKGHPAMQGTVVLRERTAERRAFQRWEVAMDRSDVGAGTTLVDQVAALVGQAPEDVAQTFLAFARLDA